MQNGTIPVQWGTAEGTAHCDSGGTPSACRGVEHVAVLPSCQGWMWESGPRAHPADHSLRNKTQINMKFDTLMSLVINIVVLWALRTCNIVHMEGTKSCFPTHLHCPTQPFPSPCHTAWCRLMGEVDTLSHAHPVLMSQWTPSTRIKKNHKKTAWSHVNANVQKHNVLQLRSSWLTWMFRFASLLYRMTKS